jgi:hypothetical protein
MPPIASNGIIARPPTFILFGSFTLGERLLSHQKKIVLGLLIAPSRSVADFIRWLRVH